MTLTPAEQAVRMLLRRRKGYTATAILCRELALRPDVLKALIWKLRRKGLAVESARGQGYRLRGDK